MKQKELFNQIVQDFKVAIELTTLEHPVGGINSLVICISARERVTHAETLLICTCIKLFSKEIRDNCILVITNVDEFEEKHEYEEWLRQACTNPRFQGTHFKICEGHLTNYLQMS